MAETSWGAASRLLAKDIRAEEKELGEAARKSGLAGSWGSFLGGLGVMALTGGIVNPIIKGIVTAGVKGVSAKAAKNIFTGKETKDTLAGRRGKFLMSEREELRQSLSEDILKGALTAGATTAAAQFSSNIREGRTGMGKWEIDPLQVKEQDAARTLAKSKYEHLMESDTWSPTLPNPDIETADFAPYDPSDDNIRIYDPLNRKL